MQQLEKGSLKSAVFIPNSIHILCISRFMNLAADTYVYYTRHFHCYGKIKKQWRKARFLSFLSVIIAAADVKLEICYCYFLPLAFNSLVLSFFYKAKKRYEYLYYTEKLYS